MNRQKKINSKVFQGFNMDIGLDRDFQHQKVWSDKMEETKHVQQMKQIDKIFQGIVKQRIFGTIIAEKSRLSNEECLTLSKMNKTVTNSFRNTRASKIYQSIPVSPTKRLSHYSIQTPIHELHLSRKQTLEPLNLTSYQSKLQTKQRSLTIDHSSILKGIKRLNSKDITSFNVFQLNSGEKSPNMSINLNSAKLPAPDRHVGVGLFRSKTDIRSSVINSKNLTSKKVSRKESMIILKEMNLTDNDPFEEHFKNLSLTPGIFLYDIKLAKETVISKTKNWLNPRLLDYFFHFFGFSVVMTFRQYAKGIEKAFNSPINLIYFFTFRVLDQSGNGFLTVSDLFRFLQKYPETSYIEQQIFRIRKRINQISQQLMHTPDDKKYIKPSLEEILIVNHKLKVDEVSELLKQSVKQEINKGGQVKLTCYSQSILSLQHDVLVRLKQHELEDQKNESQAMNAKNNNQKDNFVANQDGLRFHDFCHIFNGHRPKIFCMIVNILTGMKNQDYE